MYIAVFSCMYVYVPFACLVPVEARGRYPLDLELQEFVSHHVGASNETLVLWKNSQCS